MGTHPRKLHQGERVRVPPYGVPVGGGHPGTPPNRWRPLGVLETRGRERATHPKLVFFFFLLEGLGAQRLSPGSRNPHSGFIPEILEVHFRGLGES